ncbi:YidH family protein [Leifsonia sp. YAF41]|uniref:YidH family protein n=1 Tax=Leifsonia sp. YAF41 TaxID=3233086 RepID=UPI003F9431EF
MTLRRFPQAVYRHGEEPDPRFSLANERTFLAWIRTSLALIAAGVALEALQLPIREDFRLYSAGIFILLGLAAPVHAWFSWMRTERAMRESRPLPAPALSGILAVGIVVAALLIAVGMLLG